MATQGGALRVQICPTGKSQLVSSRLPAFTMVTLVLACGSWNRRVPQLAHSTQSITRPLSCRRAHTVGLPSWTATASLSASSERLNALPDCR